ncbi:hypothetical protein DFH05DRAFT_1618923 [Lentinula detonsa]|uniref:UDP-Glycosyltransferase/glycogen phosphorylase n=1 Tax=Lentinula detonsa TaxID=2804962 RepID=A0A9W8NYV2_9AGAR|nr:hypothetical protein DFH05DRAFT_1618923 [Lentinula detonsa]
MAATINKHIVLHAHAIAWGHNKPSASLAVLIVESCPEMVVTFLTSASMLPRIMSELERRDPSHLAQAIRTRLHVLDISGAILDPRLPLAGFELADADLQKGKAAFVVPPPFTVYAIEAIRVIAKGTPILAWWTAPARALLPLLGPSSIGGMANPSIETLDGRAAMKAKIFARKEFEPYRCTGEALSTIPGLAPLFDYEWFPQMTPLSDLTPIIERIGCIYIRETDGLICTSSSAFEPRAIAAAHKWYASIGKEWFSLASLTKNIETSSTKNRVTAISDTIIEFLNRMQENFGDLVWDNFLSSESRDWAVLEEPVDTKTPFFFAHPSPWITLPSELTNITESGCGMELTWSPQEIILSHPVTIWFITHGGWNSIQEALVYRIPLDNGVRLPYRYKDAPAPPCFTTEENKEEIRALFKRIKDEEGVVVRKNFCMLAESMGKAWDAEGPAKVDFNAFLQRYV